MRLSPGDITAATRSRGRFAGFLAVVLVLAVFDCRGATAQCGDGITEAGEDCDDGGTCIGGANAGTHCTAEADCVGNGVCIGGTHARTACAGDAACPGGVCVHCVPQGGDGCAANCTFEHDVPFPLTTGELDGLNLVHGTSGVVIASDFISMPVPLSGACQGGGIRGAFCLSDADCFSETSGERGVCVIPQETLTLGKRRGGTIPVVVRAASVKFPGVDCGNLQCCCVRGMAGKTCGGTYLEPDGMTPSLDCTPGFTGGDSVCTAAGKPPCTFVHGSGNSASGEIGCEGLDNVNVSISQDSGGMSGIAAPPQVTLSGTGGPGSASVLGTTAFSVILAPCWYSAPSLVGPDGLTCTADDPPEQLFAAADTSPAVTGVAQVQVRNANGVDGTYVPDRPLSATGAPFSCAALEQGSATGAGLAQVLPAAHRDTIGDVVVAVQFFASDVVVPTATPAACIGDCDYGGTVAAHELLKMVNIALGNTPLSVCPSDDADAAGGVFVNQIIVAVNNARHGCPTPIPTLSATPTFTPTPTRAPAGAPN